MTAPQHITVQWGNTHSLNSLCNNYRYQIIITIIDTCAQREPKYTIINQKVKRFKNVLIYVDLLDA